MADIQELAETTLGKVERFSVKAELKRAHEVIQSDETVQLIGVGNYKGSGNSLLIVTDRRLVAINETGTFNKRLQVHDISYDRVSHVASESGKTTGKLELNASGGDVSIEKVLPAGRSGEIADYIRSRMSAASSPSKSSPADELRKLAELRDAGIVTAEEFETKKAELLARM